MVHPVIPFNWAILSYSIRYPKYLRNGLNKVAFNLTVKSKTLKTLESNIRAQTYEQVRRKKR